MAGRYLRAGVAAVLVLLAPALAAAEPATAAPPAPAYVMPGTESWSISSDDGEPYSIFVSRPDGEPPAGGFPVLYVLDANAMFAGFAQARRALEDAAPEIGRTLVVGVGYPTSQLYDVRRLYDFTAAMPDPPPASQRTLAGLRSGGRERFLDFLVGTLRPEIARRYRTDPGRQALFGHSLGGLLALHALYSRPEAFEAIVAASPSLWWNDQAMLRQERDFAARLAQGTVPRASRLLVVAGEREYPIGPDAQAMARRVAPLSAHGLRMRFAIYDDENHMSVPSRAVTDALRFASGLP